MPPDDAKILSISTDTYGGALVVRAVGELDYDYAPVFRRELTRLWDTGAGAPPGQPPPPPAPSRERSPSFPGVSPLLPESPFSPVTSSLEGGPFSPAVSPVEVGSFSPVASSVEGSFSGGGSFSVDDPPALGRPFSPEHPFSRERHVPSDLPSPPDPSGPSLPDAGTTPSRLILDLTGLTFCDSTGLAELLWSLRQSQKTGTRLVVAGANRTLRHMLATTGLLAFFTMADSVEEALLEAGTGTPGEG